jgi:hypothetical protein
VYSAGDKTALLDCLAVPFSKRDDHWLRDQPSS